MRPARNDRGQVLIITAFAMIVLVAIAAIVVDLGFSWMLHRKEQNAVDPASLAAAKWIRDTPPGGLTQMQAMEGEACFYAQQNGFFVSDANCAAALASGDLDVNYPPSSNLAGNFRGRLGFVEVIIHDTHPSFFGQVFGRPVADVRTGAVAALTDGQAASSSLVALQDVCAGGAAGTVTGGGTLHIFPATGVTAPGGYINVNSPCGNSSDDQCLGGAGSSALKVDGGSTLITPFAFVTGTCALNGSGADFECEGGGTACLDEGAIPMGDPLAGLPKPRISDFPVPNCPNGTPQSTSASIGCDIGGNSSVGPGDGDGSGCIKIGTGGSATFDCTLNPGVYYAGWSVATKTAVHLRPGMYILAGGGIRLSGSSAIDSPDSVLGSGRVTIFSTDGNCPAIGGQCQGNITFTAQQGFVAKATDATSCEASVPTICAWKGILLWQDGDVNAYPSISKVTLGGQASTTLSGTIYAPRADVSINGGTATTGCSGPVSTQSCLAIQIIAWTWKIDGSAVVDMPYDPSQLYQLEQQGLVH